MTNLQADQKGWLVRVGYVGQDKELHWGEYRHSQKTKALNVYKNVGQRAYRCQVLKNGKLVFQSGQTTSYEIEDEKAWDEFFQGDTSKPSPRDAWRETPSDG